MMVVMVLSIQQSTVQEYTVIVILVELRTQQTVSILIV